MISIEEDGEIEIMKTSAVVAIALLLLEPRFTSGIDTSPLVTNGNIQHDDDEHQICDDCLPISECPALQILAERKMFSEIMKHDWCGYESNAIMMCCPHSDMDDDDVDDHHSPLQQRSKDHHRAKGTSVAVNKKKLCQKIMSNI